MKELRRVKSFVQGPIEQVCSKFEFKCRLSDFLEPKCVSIAHCFDNEELRVRGDLP